MHCPPRSTLFPYTTLFRSSGQFLKTLERYEVTVAPLVPPLVLELSRVPEVDQHDLSKLRLIHCGAAPLAAEVAEACSSRSEEHTSELQSQSNLVCRLLLEK